jgi:hypothetical protein
MMRTALARSRNCAARSAPRGTSSGCPEHFLRNSEGAFAATVVAVHRVEEEQAVFDGVGEASAE